MALIDPYGIQSTTLQSASQKEQAAAVVEWAVRHLVADADPHSASAPMQIYQ